MVRLLKCTNLVPKMRLPRFAGSSLLFQIVLEESVVRVFIANSEFITSVVMTKCSDSNNWISFVRIPVFIQGKKRIIIISGGKSGISAE